MVPGARSENVAFGIQIFSEKKELTPDGKMGRMR
jgi:hypothetical protein